ncbi:hypothetical protein C7391_0576 [Methanimicrococcus blatticola]|uniref:Uncharacterized protein n=1 Tax=Methanimicrococcus blatticola TaxID=91560 RepID=A0A484F807_9EURY|nr:hypothetical protein C7391_0576 [Methanimicrococcus blatticola]
MFKMSNTLGSLNNNYELTINSQFFKEYMKNSKIKKSAGSKYDT